MDEELVAEIAALAWAATKAKGCTCVPTIAVSGEDPVFHIEIGHDDRCVLLVVLDRRN